MVSTMKNYLFSVDCEVRVAAYEHGLEPPAAPGVREAYHDMWVTMTQSAARHLQGQWQLITITEPAESRSEMFRRTYQEIRRLWHSEPCNILFVDSDCVFVRDTDIFGAYADFRLFNNTDAARHPRFPAYYNSAVRYYASTMNPQVWFWGDLWYREWNYSIYAHEQEMYNAMFWNQNPDNPHQPHRNFQAPGAGTRAELQRWAAWNQSPVDSAEIIHYHGTRGAERARNLAQELVK